MYNWDFPNSVAKVTLFFETANESLIFRFFVGSTSGAPFQAGCNPVGLPTHFLQVATGASQGRSVATVTQTCFTTGLLLRPGLHLMPKAQPSLLCKTCSKLIFVALTYYLASDFTTGLLTTHQLKPPLLL